MCRYMAAKNLKRITAYAEPELYEKIEQLAKDDKRPLSPMIILLIEKGIEALESEKKS